MEKNDCEYDCSKNSIKNIENIVLSGGAYLGLYELGVLKYLIHKQFLNLQNIKRIFGTSIGAFIGTLLCLDIDFDKIIDYLIERPWNKVVEITPNMIFDIIHKKGLLNGDIFSIALEPLFKLKNINTDITLNEFYILTQKELYMYATNVNTMEVLELSYKTYPDLKLVESLQMTCCIPYLFQPYWFKNSYIIDGGLLNNYPLFQSFDIIEDKETILSLKFEKENDNIDIKKDCNIFEFGFNLFNKLANKYKEQFKRDYKHKNEVVIPCREISLQEGYELLMNCEKRGEYINQGMNYGKLFYSYLNK